MKSYLACGLLFLSSTFSINAATTLVDAPFEAPTGLTLRFPPTRGEQTVYHDHFSGWSSIGKGVMAITYADGLGKDRSGGMLCTAEQVSPEYNVVQYTPIKPAFNNLAFITTEEVGRFVIAFDANIPEGKELLVQFNITPPEGMESRAYASRLIFGSAVGTGKYERYTFPAKAASPASLEAFTKFLKDAGLNGATDIELQAVFFLRYGAAKWTAGESFQFDNLLITIADRSAP